jgi:ATP-dependent RNA circularization protein (DNA/RNA ligase family)
VFGLKVDGKFLDWDELEKVCGRYGVQTVPVLWRGPFSMAKAKEMADGVSTMAGHIREGTVVYPVKEREDPKVGRAVLKFIGTEYELSKHKDADTKDV